MTGALRIKHSLQSHHGFSMPPFFFACMARQLLTSCVEGRLVTRSVRDSSFARTAIITVPDSARHISVRHAQVQLSREAHGATNRIIAMSLYGNDTDYLVGAIENAVLVQRDWAGWTLRVYHDADVPEKTLRVLRDLDVQLVSEGLVAPAGVPRADLAIFLERPEHIDSLPHLRNFFMLPGSACTFAPVCIASGDPHEPAPAGNLAWAVWVAVQGGLSVTMLRRSLLSLR